MAQAFDRAAVRVLGRDLPEARPAVGCPGGQEVSIVDVHQARALVGGLVHHLQCGAPPVISWSINPINYSYKS